MATCNSCTFVANVGRDPEVKYFESGSILASFSLPVGAKRDQEPIWLEVKVWGKQAQVIADCVRKGTEIFVTGELQNETWTSTKDGEKKSKPVLNCQSFQLVGGRRQGGEDRGNGRGQAPGRSQAPKPQPRAEAPSINEEEIPF